MPTVLPLSITVVFAPPPKSVPSSLTPSQLMARKPLVRGAAGGLAPLLTPPMAASKAFNAVSAPPEVLVPPTPLNDCGVPTVIGLPGASGASSTSTVVTAVSVLVIGVAVSKTCSVTLKVVSAPPEPDSSANVCVSETVYEVAPVLVIG